MGSCEHDVHSEEYIGAHMVYIVCYVYYDTVHMCIY